MAERFFNLEEAEKLLPAIERLLQAAIESKKTVEAVETEMSQVRGRIMLLGGMLPEHSVLSQRKLKKDESFTQLQGTLQEIAANGCLVKDLDIGLVDFPCLMDDREIYLCWKLGEPKIGFWHDVEEGFGGRKPLDKEFLDRINRPRPN